MRRIHGRCSVSARDLLREAQAKERATRQELDAALAAMGIPVVES